MSLEQSFSTENYTDKLKKDISLYLTLPERINTKDFDLPNKLGDFLVDIGYIKNIEVWESSWGFKYEDGVISVSHREMNNEQYDNYIFRLGVGEYGESLFPAKEEVDQYRFLHETSHAYQSFLEDIENKDNDRGWYERVIDREIDSNYAFLFKYCLNNRLKSESRGLSTWGNVPDYNSIDDTLSQKVIRAIEDANEMITMYLWNPKYLETFLDYVSLNINGYDESNLNEDNLTQISNIDKDVILEVVNLYIQEMKEYISYKK